MLNNFKGKKVFLPATYHGSPRYMHQKILDAMAYIRKFGKPCLFITISANSKWKDI